MVTREQSPSCEVSGLPLPIVPSQVERPGLFDEAQNYHHHFHPSQDPLLTKTLGGKAVRHCRGQYGPRSLHERYHKLFDSSMLPSTAQAQFQTVVLACAGVLPRQGIDLSQQGGYRIIELSQKQFEYLADPKVIYVDGGHNKKRHHMRGRKEIGKFFTQYSLDQDISSVVSERVIDEFVSEGLDPQRKKELGNLILSEALGHTIDSLVPVHQGLYSEGLVQRNKPSNLRKVLRSFIAPHVRVDYYDEVRAILTT